MIDPTFSVIIGVIVGGLITFFTTYAMNERRYKHEKISEGIAFYRSMLPEILPLLKSVEQLKEALAAVEKAKENIIEGKKGLPSLYVDSEKGFSYLKDSELRTVIRRNLLPECIALTKSPWMAIMPGNVSMSILMLIGMVNDLTGDHWNDPPSKVLQLVDEAQKVVQDFDIAILKMLGLLSAYREIYTTKPEFVSDKLRELLEKRRPHKLPS